MSKPANLSQAERGDLPARCMSITLVGAGGFGLNHLREIELMEREGRARLLNVVEPFLDRLPEVSELLKKKRVRVYQSWEDLMAKSDVADCVVLAVPIPLHLEYAIKAYECGAYVYLEKPPVPLLSQMQRLMDLEGSNPRIQVGFSHPYSAQMELLRGYYGQGRLGDIKSYRVTACAPRGTAYYQRSSWAGKLWDGEKPVFDGPATNALAHRVYDFLNIEAMVTGTPVMPTTVQAELYRARPIESYDVCCARGEFCSGTNFSVSLSHACGQSREVILKVVGTKGSATIEGKTVSLISASGDEYVTPDNMMFHTAYRDFLQTASEGGRPRIGLRETYPYVATTNAMFVSSGIREISAEHWELDADVYKVNGLEAHSESVFSKGLSFSEAGAPWASAGKCIQLDQSLAAAMDDAFGKNR